MRAVRDGIEEKLGPMTHGHSPSVLYKVGECPCVATATYNTMMNYVQMCVSLLQYYVRALHTIIFDTHKKYMFYTHLDLEMSRSLQRNKSKKFCLRLK